jgi:hypothetical protein
MPIRLCCLVVAAAALLAGGCGSEPPEEAPGMPAALATDLAERSDLVAQALEHGDGCAALQRAKQLRTAVERAIAEGRVPARLQAELRRRAGSLARSIVCVQPIPPPPPPTTETETEEEDDD